jgi:hypothetical protein
MMLARVDVGDGAPRIAELGDDVAEGEEDTEKPEVASPRLGDILADAKRRPEHATTVSRGEERCNGEGASMARRRSRVYPLYRLERRRSTVRMGNGAGDREAPIKVHLLKNSIECDLVRD